MSRLIDADTLLKGKTDHEMISTHLVWNAPTVEAIPIAWLRKWAKNTTVESQTPDGNYLTRVHYAPIFEEAIRAWQRGVER